MPISPRVSTRRRGASGKKLKIVVDIDPGMGRTGIRPDKAVALVEQVAEIAPISNMRACNATRARCSTWNRRTSGATRRCPR